MVRGNWQKRVEMAEARRSSAKQRKQRTEDKRMHKQYAAELLQLLDRHGRRPLRLHIWTDVIGVDSPPLLDIVVADEDGKKRRPRVGSIESDDGNKKSGRGRSDSDVGSKTKSHPRSHKVEHEIEEREAPLLCRSHFFYASCERKKCRYLHYSARYQTVATALNPKSLLERRDPIKLAEEAAELVRSDPDAMEMVYYMTVELKASDDEQDTPPISDELMEVFSVSNIKLGNIVYVTLDQSLIFDRNRSGLTVSDREFLFLIAGEDPDSRRYSVVSEGDESLEETLNQLPGTVLEHMLTFLPDTAVASASQVCKAWHYEIGHSSPSLWHYLLERRKWPSSEAEEESGPERDQVRMMFIEHYTAMRDAKAIQTALCAISSKKSTGETEMCYQDFSTRKYAPSEPNCCVAVQTWSASRVLAAYSKDCSLRLFETVAKAGGDEKSCKELVYQRVDPYRNSKRRNCTLVSVGLDEDMIGCLLHVMADNVEAEAYVLVVLTRDDFLLGESSAADGGGFSPDVKLHVIDIGEAVLNYLLSSDVVDHRLLLLLDFLADGGEIGDVEVLVSRSMAACGYGRFLVEVAVSIPSTDPNINPHHDDVPMHLLDRKLVLFSAAAGAIVWMGESNDLSRPLRPRFEDMTLAYLRLANSGGSRTACSILVASQSSPAILTGAIEPTGHVQSVQLVEASDLVRHGILYDGWIVTHNHFRPVAITSTDLVASDTMERRQQDDDRVLEAKSIISFYPRFPALDQPRYSTLELNGDLDVVRIASLRDNHVLVICREFQRPVGDDNIRISVQAIVLHVPSRSEIGRVSLIDRVGPDITEVPEITAVNGDTIGVGLSWKGVVMTGSAVRSIGQSVTIVGDKCAIVRSSKKKKKRPQNKGSKKDGFARGMSLRG